MDSTPDGKTNWLAQRRAAELVRMRVAANTLADMPQPSLQQRLAAAHFELCSTVSPLAMAAALWG